MPMTKIMWISLLVAQVLCDEGLRDVPYHLAGLPLDHSYLKLQQFHVKYPPTVDTPENQVKFRQES